MEKRMILFALPFLLLVTLLSFAGATLTVPDISELPHSSGSFTVNITSDQNETVSVNIDSIVQGTREITFAPPIGPISLNDSSQLITVNYNVPSGFIFELGQTYSTNLELNGTVSGALTKDISFEEGNFCEDVPNEGRLDIRDIEISTENGFGDDDNFWYLLDEVSVDVEVDNIGSWDIRDVQVEWALYTTAGDLIMDGDVRKFNLDRGDDDTVTFTFKLDEDLKDFEGENAILYIKATGEIDDKKSPFYREDTCGADSFEVEVVTDDEFSIADSLSLNGNPVVRNDLSTEALICGETAELTGTVYNLGDRDQDEVKIKVFNNELKIDETVNLGDIDAFDSQDFSLRFDIPNDVEDKNYRLDIYTFDEDGRLFENNEDDKSITTIYFKASGNCGIEVPPTVSAEMSSGEAREGNEITIRVSVKNEGSGSATFSLAPQGYETWAELVNISSATFTLEPGASKDAFITFDLKSDSEGERQFNIAVTSNGQVVANKAVLLSVLPSDSFWDNLTDNVNWEIVGIVALNVILLIAIIVVAIKILRKK